MEIKNKTLFLAQKCLRKTKRSIRLFVMSSRNQRIGFGDVKNLMSIDEVEFCGFFVIWASKILLLFSEMLLKVYDCCLIFNI